MLVHARSVDNLVSNGLVVLVKGGPDEEQLVPGNLSPETPENKDERLARHLAINKKLQTLEECL